MTDKEAAIVAMGNAFRACYRSKYGCKAPDGDSVRIQCWEDDEGLVVELSAPRPVREETG